MGADGRPALSCRARSSRPGTATVPPERILTATATTAALPWRSLAAVIAGLTVASMTAGFNAPLFSARLDAAGYSEVLIGLSAGANAAGLFVVSPFAAGLLSRHGLVRVMVWTSFLSAALYVACGLMPGFLSWTLLRLAMGAIGGILWIAGEVWITQAATDSTRGRVLAIYNSFFGIGTAAGPTILAWIGHEGMVPFMVAAAITLVSVLPIVWARAMAPVIERQERGGFALRPLLAALRRAPVPMMLNLSFALVFAALWSLLPVYVVAAGLPVERAFQQLTAFAVGTIVLQLPVGWLADRIDRHLIATILLGISVVALALIGRFVANPGLDLAYFFVVGGTISGLYVIALSIIGDRFRGSALAAAVTVYTLMWSLGSIVGPPAAGLAGSLAGEHGLPVVLVLFTALFLPFTLASWLKARRVSA